MSLRIVLDAGPLGICRRWLQRSYGTTSSSKEPRVTVDACVDMVRELANWVVRNVVMLLEEVTNNAS